MFFSRKINPEDKQKVLEVLRLWNRHVMTVDSATDEMRLASVEENDGILSSTFETRRIATVEVVKGLLGETKSQDSWPELEDEKGFSKMLLLRSLLNEIHAQQLDSLRLQKEYVETIKTGNMQMHTDSMVTQVHLDSMQVLHLRMGENLDALGKAASQLSKHYKIKLKEYMSPY